MINFLKKFATHNEYVAFLQTANFVKPNVSYCVDNREVHYNPWTYADEYLTFVALESGTFTLSINDVSYSLDDGETWTVLTAGNESPAVTAGNKIMWKGNLTIVDFKGIGIFGSTGRFDVKGNIMSLLYGDNFKRQTDLTGKVSAFASLFDSAKVVNAKDLSLPATTLANNCYSGMFSGCTSLTTAPELPATTLAEQCYNSMFNGCTGLTTAPELPATTLASNCYISMFYGCTSLTTAPELPATTLTSNCYISMFYGCTSLTTAPELPATTLTNNCYSGMFYGCTGLTTAPELPATTLVSNCYQNMFRGCTSLTTAPELPATTLTSNCYQNMFRSCTSLNYIKAMFTTTPSGSSPNYYTQNWVNGVAASGTFIKNSAASWDVTGVNGIPSGWTIQTASA